MLTGLLWHELDPKASIQWIVRQAALRYAEKFGSLPDSVFVHPEQIFAPDPDLPLRVIADLRLSRSSVLVFRAQL